jgi:hypothetical protein
MFARWRSTVFSLIVSSSAISLLVTAVGDERDDLQLAGRERLLAQCLAGARGASDAAARSPSPLARRARYEGDRTHKAQQAKRRYTAVA